MFPVQGKWACLIGGIIIHFAYGYFYTIGMSSFCYPFIIILIGNVAPYIIDYLGIRNKSMPTSSITWITSVSVGFEAIGMPLGGFMERKTGVRKVLALSALLQSSGVILTYFSIKLGFLGIILTYSVLQGFGFGFGYSVTMTAAAKWFPKRAGLVMGLVVAGFGAGPILFSPIQTFFVNPKNVMVNNITRRFDDPEMLSRVPYSFLILGSILFGMQLIGVILVNKNPTEIEVIDPTFSEDWKEVTLSEPIKEVEELKSINLTPKQIIRTCEFYLLWITLFFHAISLIVFASLYKVVGQRSISDDMFLSIVGSIAAIFNSGGRIVWGFMVDLCSYKVTALICLPIYSALLFIFPHLPQFTSMEALPAVYFVLVCANFLMISCGLVLVPKTTQILFGIKHLAVNYGIVFSAYVFGALFGAMLITIPGQAVDWRFPFYIGAGSTIFALVFTVWIPDPKVPRPFRFLEFMVPLCSKIECCQKTERIKVP